MPYTVAKYIKQEQEYRCGISECNKLLFKGEIITGRVEKKCQCGAINIIDAPVKNLGAVDMNGSYQDRLNLVKKHR